jgi:hypothetical protein
MNRKEVCKNLQKKDMKKGEMVAYQQGKVGVICRKDK